MKVGIVVPFSWTFWGAVNEHAELQAAALRRHGVDSRTLIGNDPAGQFTRVLHPRVARQGEPPPDVIPVGRSVIVPANGSLPNVVLSPRAFLRIRAALERERFDVLHLHEPMTPVVCIFAAAIARMIPIVATSHASGELGWMRLAVRAWKPVLDRVDYRIAVSQMAADSAARWVPGEYHVIPNGVLIPPAADPAAREHRILFAGRQEPRKGLRVLLEAWPEIRRRTGARLRIAGADPLAVRLLLQRARVSDEGIDILGFLSQEDLTAELLSVKALVAPSLGGESFGMVLTRAFACATPVVASDIAGYRDVMTPDTGLPLPAGRPGRARRCDRVAAGRRAAPRGARRRGAAGRDLELLVGRHRAAADLGLRAGSGRLMRAFVRHPLTRVGLVVLAAVGVILMLWWRGPNTHTIAHAFSNVVWKWVLVALLFNLLSIVARALCWKTVIDVAMPKPRPGFTLVFSAFSVGLFANAVLPGRVGELARVGVLTRRMPGRKGLWATLVGTVFAHRVFDLVPVLILVVYVIVFAKIPAWAVTSLIVVVCVGIALFTFAFASARLHHGQRVEGLGSVRRVVTMGRHGLGVMRAGWSAVLAVSFQCLGWLFQLLAVYTAMRAFHIHSPLPAAGLVLLLMNVATIFPLWPGNIGLMQAAVALPLVTYGVPYAKGFAFGIGLQAIEASVGIGIGLVFLAHEGISLATLRGMPGAERADEAVDEAEGMVEDDAGRPRDRVPG